MSHTAFMIDAADLQAFSALLGEPESLRVRRLAAFDRLPEAANVSLLAATDTPIVTLSPEDLHVQDRISILRIAPDQTSSADDVALRLFGSLLPSDEEAFRHAAFLSGALVISIPDGVTLQKPLRIQWNATAEWTATHTLVVLGHRSKAMIAEELCGEQGTWSHVREVILHEEASAEFISMQSVGRDLSLRIRARGSIGSGGSLTWHEATLGSLVEQELWSEATGDHASSSINWLFYAKNTERQRLSCRNIFQANSGTGEIRMRGVAEQKAQVRCDGMIDIGLKGGGTDTYLTQEVLMLDPTAKVDAIPALEIKTNDVKASHSATVARVTEEDLFYFAARGIGKDEARGMFIRGFLLDLLGQVSDEPMREAMMQKVEEKYERP